MRVKYRLAFMKRVMPFTVGVKRFFLLNVLLSVISLSLNFIKPLFYRIFINDPESVTLTGIKTLQNLLY